MPETRKFICQDGSSNKVWQCTLDGRNVLYENGRIGNSKLQQTPKQYPTPHSAQAEMEKKISAKLRKGYEEVTAEKLEKEESIATKMGAQYKINSVQFISSRNKGKFTFSDKFDPKYGLFVTIMDSWSKKKFFLQISKTHARQYRNAKFNLSVDGADCTYATTPDSGFVEGVREYLNSLAAEVVEVVKQITFGGVGTRAIDLDGAVATADTTTQVIDTFKSQGNSASASVVSKFAGLGNRVLDI